MFPHRPHLFIAPQTHLARRAALDFLRENGALDPFEPPVIFASASAAPHWRALFREAGANAPRLLRAEEFFVRSHRANARARAVSGRDRLWILSGVARNVAPHLEFLGKAVASREWLHGISAFLCGSYRALAPIPDFEWKHDFEILRAAYEAKLEELGAFDAECAPALFPQSAAQNAAFGWPKTLVWDETSEISPALRVGFEALLANCEFAAATLACPGGVLPKMNPHWQGAQKFWRAHKAKTVMVSAPKLHRDRCAAKILGQDNGASAPDNLFFTPCHTMHDEISRIAALIRRELNAGAPLENFALVIPQTDRYDGVLQSVFAAYGVPISLPFSRPLAQSPLIRRLLLALESCKNLWNVHVLHDLLGDGTLRFESLDAQRLRRAAFAARFFDLTDPAHTQTVFQTKIAQLREGRRDDETRREAIASALENDDLGAVSRLKELCAASAGTRIGARAWLENIETLLQKLAVHFEESDDLTDANELAHQTAREQLARLREAARALVERAGAWSGETDEVKRAPSEWLEWLRFECEAVQIEENARGAGVVISGATGSFEWRETVFFAGLSENAWPSPQLSGPLAERGRDAMAKLRAHEASPLARATHTLAKAVGSCQRLFLSYPQHSDDRENGPSPLWEDVRALWENTRWPSLPKLTESEAIQPLCRRAWLSQMAKIRAQNPDIWPASLTQLETLHTMREERRSPAQIGVYDGVLGAAGAPLMALERARWGQLRTASANTAKTENENGKTEREPTFSASQLELYARCPLRFFFGRILELAPEEPIGDDLDAREVGTLVHDVLYEFHRTLRAPLGEIEPATALGILRELAWKNCEKLALRPILREAEFHRLMGLNGVGGPLWKLLRAEFRAALASEGGPWSRPTAPIRHSPFFQELGKVAGGDTENWMRLGLEERFEIRVGGVPISGIIDRIDAASDGSLVVILDYKTGGAQGLPNLEKGDDGLSFQLALYAMRAASYFASWPRAPKLAMGFFSLKSGEFLHAIGQNQTLGRLDEHKFSQPRAIELDDSEWENWLRGVETRVGQIAAHIENGTFNISLQGREKAKCNFCEFSGFCGQHGPTQSERAAQFGGGERVYLPLVSEVGGTKSLNKNRKKSA